MTLLRVAFRTLGCKLNQLETESVADSFVESGAVLVDFEESADLYVVNTCTVTGKAEQKARRVIRQALERNPRAVVLVTGCYAQMDPEGLSLIHPRSIVLPGDEKPALLKLSAWLQDNWQGHGDLFDATLEWKSAQSAEPGDRFAYHPRTFAFHSRPSLKIQDGCDNRCSYCRVCLARGRTSSLDANSVLGRVRELEAAGKSEVVLTGVNLSQYRDGAMNFSGLLEFLIANSDSIRFRISSWEPEKVDDAFIRVFANSRVQPHIHFAMQSGSDSVLRRMARPYTAARIGEAAAALRAAREDPFLAADVIAGFPGETEGEFGATLDLCRELDLAWIHAFPFSARPGTRAFDMRPKVPERIAGERVQILTELAQANKRRYAGRQAGKTLSAVLEKSGDESEDSLLRLGTTDNYLKVCLEGVPRGLAPGSLVTAVVTGADAGSEFAQACDIRAKVRNFESVA